MERTTPDEWARRSRAYPASMDRPGPREPSLTPYVIDFERAFSDPNYSTVALVCGSQMGKALALDTEIPTPGGWRTMADLQPGDRVFDEQGQPCNVLTVTPPMGNRPCYRVTFCDGTTIVADAQHKWMVNALIKRRSGNRREVEIKTTQQMLARGVRLANGGARFSVTLAKPVAEAEANLPIHPYVFGAWLGDGNSRCAAITSGRQDAEEMTRNLTSCGVVVKATKEGANFRLSVLAMGVDGAPIVTGKAGNLTRHLREMGVRCNKHIPSLYLCSSIAQRTALLNGLMDTDGWADVSCVRYASKSMRLAEDVATLAASLGYRPRLATKCQDGYTSYVVSWKAYSTDAIFRFERKQRKLERVSKASRPWLNTQRYVQSIEPIASVPVKCISVDSPSRCFLASRRYIPTHNSESILDVIGWRFDQKPTPALYVGPSQDFIVDEIEPRVMDLINQAPTLAQKLSRGKKNKRFRKVIGGVPLKFAWAGSPTQLSGTTAGLVMVDEYDRMMADVKGEGDPLELTKARGFTFRERKYGVTSTPKTGNIDTELAPSGLEFWKRMPPEDIESPVWKLYQSGTMFHFAWPCPQCAEYFIPRFKQLTWPKDATPSQALEQAHVVCPRCGGVVEEHHKPDMNARGVYIAPGQTVDTEGNISGDPPKSSTISFWVSGLCSPFVKFGERARDYLEARNSGDQEKLQTVINTGFGELWAPAGGDAPEWAEVAKLKQPYRLGDLPVGTVHLTCGVDVQANRLIYSIRAWGPRATSWLIDRGELHGETHQEEVWEDLADLLETPIHGMMIRRCLIDSGFRPGKPFTVPVNRVYEFCRRHARVCSPTKGRATQSMPVRKSKIEVNHKGVARKYSLELLLIDTDWAKSSVHEHIRYPDTALGAWLLPEDIDDAYCAAIVSEARVKKPSGRVQWVQRSRENHYLDTEALNWAAGHLLNVQRIKEGRGLREAAVAETEDDAPLADGEVEVTAAPAETPAAAPAKTPAKAGKPKTMPTASRPTLAQLAARLNR